MSSRTPSPSPSPSPSPPSHSHFLSLPRPPALAALPMGVPDTTTVAAHDFDVDARTGFMPSQPPLARLPGPWEPWEAALARATAAKLKLGGASDLTAEDALKSERWREEIRKIPVLPTAELKQSEVVLRRAHHVLTWTMHFYINTLPPTAPVLIPRPLSIPLLEVSSYLSLPPLLTYSDDVLYNWKFISPPSPAHLHTLPTQDNITIQTSFTSTPSEAHFYLTSAYIELRGAAALALMSRIMDEAFVNDALARRRIALYLRHLAAELDALRALLLAVRRACDPEVFFHAVRPWFKGQDAMPGARRWVFEGVGEPAYAHLRHPRDEELSGPSAGQSSLIHAIDIFLGVESHAPAHGAGSGSDAPKAGADPTAASAPASQPTTSFLTRMQSYMPRHHRAFLHHLSASPRPLRALIASLTTSPSTSPSPSSGAVRNPELLAAYNTAVTALRLFRDAHLRIVALYIVGPARRVDAGQRALPSIPSAPDAPAQAERTAPGSGSESESEAEAGAESDAAEVKGTGGTNAMVFLKGVRDRTAEAVFREQPLQSPPLPQ